MLKPSHVVDEDLIGPAELAPTLAQLIKKHKRQDLLDHFALVLGMFDAQGNVPVAYLGDHPVPVAREAIEMLCEFIDKSGWGAAKDYFAEYLPAVKERNETLRRLARERGYPGVAAIVIAAQLLDDPSLTEYTTIPLSEERAKNEGRDRKPMEVGTLAKIISDENAK